MVRSRIFWRLYGGYVLLILLTTITVGVLVGQRVERDTVQEIQESLESKAAMLRALARSPMGAPLSVTFQGEVKRLGEETDTRLTVIRVDGVVLADSDENPAEMDNHAGRPEVLDAMHSLDTGGEGKGQATRLSSTVGREMMYLALTLSEGDRLLGYVRSSLPLTAVDERLARLRGIVILGAGIAALLALIMGFFAARRLTAPITSMTEVAEAIAGGDYRRRVGGSSKDEIGKLARAFDTMAVQLEERMETIIQDRNKLLAILGGMVEGVVAVDRETKIVHMNSTAGQILGASSSTDLGKPIWEVTRIKEIAEALSRTARGGRQKKEEFQLVRLGSERTIQTHASPLRDGDGKPAGAVMVLHDVSELRRLETVRSEFVANASHELKTPITAIRGLVDTLVEDKEIGAETRSRFLEKVRRQSDRLSSLVGDLLALSRLESEKSTPERAIDIRDPVLESVRVLSAGAEKKGLQVETQVSEDPVMVMVMGDAEMVREIADNLLDNAIKYTSATGEVRVRLRVEGAWAVLEVEDDGIGIEPGEQERIFERFYRVDRARSRELGGTGLGLAIVKHSAVRLGGEVSVESTPGSGSRFTVRLPLASGCVRPY